MSLAQVPNLEGQLRVVVTKELPGGRWKDILISAGCRVEVCTASEPILGNEHITALIGDKCDAVIGQLTETWGAELFQALQQAGGRYCP